jgi:holo-[acyl-carrier protein] synthase
VRIGIDLLAIDELDRLVERTWFTRYVFADAELADAAELSGARRREFLAGRFAAKEAVLKVLGVGLFQGVSPRDIAVTRLSAGTPLVTLQRSAARAARLAEITHVTLSITHKRGLAAVVAMGWQEPGRPG